MCSFFVDYKKAMLTKDTERQVEMIRALPQRQRSWYVISESNLFQAGLILVQSSDPPEIGASISTLASTGTS